jgi:hypothetical protein
VRDRTQSEVEEMETAEDLRRDDLEKTDVPKKVRKPDLDDSFDLWLGGM